MEIIYEGGGRLLRCVSANKGHGLLVRRRRRSAVVASELVDLFYREERESLFEGLVDSEGGMPERARGVREGGD